MGLRIDIMDNTIIMKLIKIVNKQLMYKSNNSDSNRLARYNQDATLIQSLSVRGGSFAGREFC